MKIKKVAPLVAGCIAFGAILSLRDVVEDIWIRALIAGIAGGLLGATLFVSSKTKSSQRQG